MRILILIGCRTADKQTDDLNQQNVDFFVVFHPLMFSVGSIIIIIIIIDSSLVVLLVSCNDFMFLFVGRDLTH